MSRPAFEAVLTQLLRQGGKKRACDGVCKEGKGRGIGRGRVQCQGQLLGPCSLSCWTGWRRRVHVVGYEGKAREEKGVRCKVKVTACGSLCPHCT